MTGRRAVFCLLATALLTGAWRSSLKFKTWPFAGVKDLEFMYVFNEGGTLTESSSYDGAPPVPGACGVWRSVGPNEFEAKYGYFGNAPSGRGVLTERIALSADARTFRRGFPECASARRRASQPAGSTCWRP